MENAEESKKIPLGWIDLSFEIFLQLCQGECKGKRWSSQTWLFIGNIFKEKEYFFWKIENILNNFLIETKDFIFNSCSNQDEENMMAAITDQNERALLMLQGEICWCRSCLGCFNTNMARRRGLRYPVGMTVGKSGYFL